MTASERIRRARAQRIEHADIEAGDVIELAGEPATVVRAWTFMGYRVLDIRRDDPRRTGRWHIGSPVVLLDRVESAA
jgi:hypothetical protein